MNTKSLMRGIQTLLPYYDDENGYHSGSDHDVFYMFATDKPVSEEDQEELEVLGWYQPHGAEYSQSESWYAYI